jgi:hypothetical protein
MFTAFQLLFVVVSGVCLVLAACVALRPVFVSVRWERSEALWCEPCQQPASVKFVERSQPGKVTRHVLHCPLRPTREHCSEMCMLSPALQDALLANVEVVRRAAGSPLAEGRGKTDAPSFEFPALRDTSDDGLTT